MTDAEARIITFATAYRRNRVFTSALAQAYRTSETYTEAADALIDDLFALADRKRAPTRQAKRGEP